MSIAESADTRETASAGGSPSFRPGQPVRVSLCQLITKAVLISLRATLPLRSFQVPFIPSQSPNACLSCLSSVCFPPPPICSNNREGEVQRWLRCTTP